MKRWMMTAGIALCAFTSSAHPTDDATLADFISAQQLTVPAHFHFKQSRTIRGLPRPLMSQGQLYITADAIEWRTTHPLQQRLTITAKGIVEDGADNSMRGSEIIATLLMAILRGDSEQIERNFHYTIDYDGDKACLDLTPRNKVISQFVQRIESCGSPKLDTIELLEQGGNRSIIALQPLDKVTK